MKLSKEQNMVGHFEVDFYMEDSSQAEMGEIFDAFAEEIEGILMDYDIVSVDDFMMAEESYPTRNRATALMGLELEDKSVKERLAGIRRLFTRSKLKAGQNE